MLFVAVIEPNLDAGGAALPTATAVLYPGAQLILFALAARLAISTGLAHRGVPMLLFVWIGGELVADLFYGVQSANGTFSYEGPLIPVWMVAHTALAAFAAHPGTVGFLHTALGPSGRADANAPTNALRRLRLAVLVLAALVPLVLAALRDGLDVPLLLVAAAMFGLVLYHASLLAGDLSEQRRLGEELEEAAAQMRNQHRELARLAAVVEATSDAVVTFSPEGVVLDWNGGAERLYGYMREEAVGQHARLFLPPGEQHRYESAMSLVAQGGDARVESPALHKDGSPVEVEVTVSSILDENDALYAFVGISRDITERNALQRELAAHARRLDEAQRMAGVGSWEWDLASDGVTWSPELYRIFSLDRSVAVSPQIFLQRVHEGDRDWVEQEIQRSDAMDFETRIVRADGEMRYIAIRGEVTVDPETGASVRKTGTVQDITERAALRRELAAQARRLDEAQGIAGVGSFECDLLTGRDVWSSEYYRILGLDEDHEASYAVYLDRLHPEDRSSLQEQMRLHRPGQPLEYEARIVRPDGQVRWIAVRAQIETNADGVPVRKVGTAHDITDRKVAEAELERLAVTDSLTGLPNRDRFTHLLQSALDKADGESAVGLLLLDLDGFKDVNDGIGHDAGDVVLQEVARRVRAVLRRGDEVARLGGDEFAVVLPDITRPDDAVTVATTVRSCLEPAFDLDGITVHIGASIGIVVTDELTDPGVLLKQADVAMYRAKTLASGWAVFEPDQDDLAAERLQMVAELRGTIERGELEVAYQPILDTRTRRISSFEALARWRHPDKGPVPPSQFIPLAEQADLIVPLTRLVLREAVATCAGWRKAGHDLRVGVNLSVQVMETEDPCAMVVEALAAADLDPQHLVLEITESSLATEGGEISASLRALRDLGVALVIDDFGTGYSAMSYLKQLPVEELKIDRSFIRDITSDTRDLAIVRSLVRLAHSLSLRVVAEGVESEPALEVLTALGCDFTQGYGIARPMSADEATVWLARYDEQTPQTLAQSEPTDLLVVDDSAVVRTRLTALAAEAGWQVRAATSAEEAIAEVERRIPDAVILDHHMTGMTGIKCVPELRARGVDGPILLFTQFLSDAIPSLRVPLDVWPVSKTNTSGVMDLLEGYRASTRQPAHIQAHADSSHGRSYGVARRCTPRQAHAG